MVQIHKEFTDSQVKELIECYLKREIKIHYVLETLGIKRGRFFVLLKQYKECPINSQFSMVEKLKPERFPKALNTTL